MPFRAHVNRVFAVEAFLVFFPSRMESHGLPDRVHISEATFKLLEGQFEFEARGPLPIKGKGVLSTWFLAAQAPGQRN